MAILAAKTPFPTTSPDRYLTGLTALNIEGFADRPPGPFTIAGMNMVNTNRWLGDAGIFDARPRLEPYHLNCNYPCDRGLNSLQLSLQSSVQD